MFSIVLKSYYQLCVICPRCNYENMVKELVSFVVLYYFILNTSISSISNLIRYLYSAIFFQCVNEKIIFSKLFLNSMWRAVLPVSVPVFLLLFYIGF